MAQFVLSVNPMLRRGNDLVNDQPNNVNRQQVKKVCHRYQVPPKTDVTGEGLDARCATSTLVGSRCCPADGSASAS